MYMYKPVTISQIAEKMPEGEIFHTLFIDGKELERSRLSVFSVTEKTILTPNGMIYLPKYFTAALPEDTKAGDNVLLGISKGGKNDLFFVEKNHFNSIDRDLLNSYVETYDQINILDIGESILKADYANASILYEVPSVDEEGDFIVSYINQELFNELTLLFGEDIEYTPHKEPLLHMIGEDMLMMITESDLENEKVRLLTIDESYRVLQQAHLYESDLLEYLKGENLSLRHFLDAKDGIEKTWFARGFDL